MPHVSVIVPCYNVEKYITRCLNSLINQTLKDIEIICIDDCSTDNTVKIINNYKKNDNRIILIKNKKNNGVSYSRNQGIKKASADYIGFVDPDDYVDLDFYEKLFNYAQKNHADIAKGVLSTIYTTGETKIDLGLNKSINKNKYEFNYQFTTAIYNKKKLYKHKINFPENTSFCEDGCFLIRAVHYANKIILTSDTKYNYVRRENSLDNSVFSTKNVKDALMSTNNIIEFINNTKISDSAYHIYAFKAIGNIRYICNKTIPDDSYEYIISNLINNYKLLHDKNIFSEVFNKKIAYYISKENKKKIFDILSLKRHLVKLFGLIPIGRYYCNNSLCIFKLFNIIPIFTIKHTYRTNVYVFGILIFRIK